MQQITEQLYNWASEVDAHLGIGATVGSVIPTDGAVIPAAVGVDIGCGMIAVRTDLAANDLPETLDPYLPLVEQAASQPDSGAGTRGPRTRPRPGSPAIVRRVTSASWSSGRWINSGRWAPVTTSSRSASTRSTTCGSCSTRAAVVSATSSPPSTSTRLGSSPSTSSWRSRTRTSPTSPKARRSSRPRSPTCCGRRRTPSPTASR
jgi:hypothetical protein